jgi:hypothetical protein
MKTSLDYPNTNSFSFSKKWVTTLQRSLIDEEIKGVELKETRRDGTEYGFQ